MLGYCMIGVSDMDRATTFYDSLLGELDARPMFSMDRIRGYGIEHDRHRVRSGRGVQTRVVTGS